MDMSKHPGPPGLKAKATEDLIFRDGFTACWHWTGPTDRGYGKISVNARRVKAHRFIYEREVGPIPDGLTLDHLCRNTACVNPAHLEPVTNSENVRRQGAALRKDVCPRGHALDHVRPNGYRYCTTCHNARRRKVP